MSEHFTLPNVVQALPIADVAEDVFRALKTGNVLLSAEPGAGKSTALPLALLPAASPAKRIIMLEPRRLAAMGVAERLAAHLNESVGQQIGLRMRGQTSVSSNTVLEVVTEGVLTRLLQADPTLEGIGCIIFDEFHERSLHADLGLAFCLDVQRSIRDDLRLLLMSATLDMEDLSKALGELSSIRCAGRQHPVQIRWLGSSKATQAVQVAAAVRTALENDPGDILVFLPGIAEIERTARSLASGLGNASVKVLKLHGRADAQEQRAAVAPATAHHRRIILSTSIAETSITIDGVQVVIDAGLDRRSRVNHQTGSQQLETVSACQASATQRTGRAGRTSAGVCYRLWSEHDHARRSRSWQPEILRAELSALYLEMGLWGVADADALPWLEPPPKASLAKAEQLLMTLGLWQDGRLTNRGKDAAALPVHPRLAHMLLWGTERGVSELACKLAALLEEGGSRQGEMDVEALVQRKFTHQQQRRVAQLLKLLSTFQARGSKASARSPSVGVLLAQAYPDWIAQRRPGVDVRYALACGGGAFMHDDNAIAQQHWLAIASMGGSSREARIFLASSLSVDELEAWSPEQFIHHKYLAWDDQQERVVAEQRNCIGKLTVISKPITDISDEQFAQALLDGIRKRGIGYLPWNDECRQWQARVALMSTLDMNPKQGQWPRVDDASLMSELDDWLPVWLNGVRNLKALAQLDLLSILRARLDYQQQQRLDEWLPVRFSVPSGSNIKLRYVPGEVPVLSVKLQEMFGARENPSVAQGKLPLKVELLSPARRPVQLTTDLANFWSNSYPAVKKDLAGRYPKHDWPDDPLSAKPTAYAKRRKKKP